MGLALNAGAQTVTILHTFSSSATNGYQSYARLVQGSDGNFYGTTELGGSAGVGAVFRISPSGAYTNLYSFASTFTGDGWQPLAGLVQGSDGNFYGTTSAEGTNSCQCGNVFRISPSGSYATLHYFSALTTDGGTPRGTLVQGSDGNFYGTATRGGSGTGGGGVVFRISPGGSYTNLYSFPGYSHDGYSPIGALVQGSDGNFYGTTGSGGTNSKPRSCRAATTISTARPRGAEEPPTAQAPCFASVRAAVTRRFTPSPTPRPMEPNQRLAWCWVAMVISMAPLMEGGQTLAAAAPSFESVPAGSTRRFTPLARSVRANRRLGWYQRCHRGFVGGRRNVSVAVRH